ncbi:MAG: hypothetical protein IKL23_03570 [Oscillospiraceae bacterium]|nr:hypothetical protein [Oscillospiraceae bacterium]
MFGYVLPSREKLTEEERAGFQSMYCGLCHTLREKYGFAASLILNYDLTYLAVLLSDGEEEQTACRRCVAHPCKGRCAAKRTTALEKAAACSVILAYWQIMDGIHDSRGWKRLKYRAAERVLRGAYRKAAEDRPTFDEATRLQLIKLDELEKNGCTTLDEPADAFAELLAGVAAELDDPVRQRVYREMLYHMGRWIYLVDAADDLEKDYKSGSFNPLIPRYGLTEGKLTDEAKQDFAMTLDRSVRSMAAAFELWDFGCWTALLRSTFYEGLYQVGHAVLAGEFRRAKRSKNKEGNI